MPIAELGYRHWEGARTGALRRALAIAKSEIGIAYQSSKLLRRFLFVAWMPILYVWPFFLAVGYIADPANDLDSGAMLTELAREFLSREAVQEIRARPEYFLPRIWSVAFYFFFAYTQSFLSMIVVAIVGPPLIAKDVRSKAFLVYYSKPIRPWQYLLGKLSTVMFFVFSMTLVPALLLYAVGVAMSPNADTLLATLPIVLKVAIASALIAVPVAMVVLLLSSLTKDRRIATFAWVGIWIFGEIAFRVLSVTSNFSRDYETPPWASLLSIRELTTRATAGAFQVGESLEGLFSGLGASGEELRRTLGRMASGMGDPRLMDAPRRADVLDIVGGGFRPMVSIGVLIGLSLVCALLVVRRSTRPVRV